MEAIRNESVQLEVPASLSDLIAQIALGKETALATLYEATVGKLYALARAILGSIEDTEDVVSMTYAYVWANARTYDETRGSVLGWLLMACRSRALDRLRQRRAQGEAVVPVDLELVEAEHGQPDDILSLLQQSTRIRAAIAGLSPVRRRLVSFSFLQGLSHHEIAHATGMAVGTVKSHLRRALAQLREELEGT